MGIFIVIGIYKITSPSKKVYIGQSIQIETRWKGYKKLKCKQQQILYKSLKKYGANKHKFEVLIECKKEELNDLEVYYIELYQSFNTKFGMNLRTGGSRIGVSDETKQRMSISAKKRIITQEWKDAISKANFKRYANGYLQPKFYGKDNHYFGKKHTEEIKIKMRKSKNVGENNSKAKLVLNLETGIYYGCGADAAKSISIRPSSLQQMLVGYRKNKTSFIYA